MEQLFYDEVQGMDILCNSNMTNIPFYHSAQKSNTIFMDDGSTESTLSRLQRTRERAMAIANGNSPPGRDPGGDKSNPEPKTTSTMAGKKLIALACSTGGPQALHVLLPMLPAHIGAPMVIVQHMPNGFTASLAERLNTKSAVTVKEAEDQEELLMDHVYIAPGGRHLEVVESGGKQIFRVFDDPPVNNLRPCADVMYESLRSSSYDQILCVVLTGMGADGSAGIASLGQKKPIYVITQSEETCVVYGMPKATDKLGLSNESLPLEHIANAISKKMGV